MKSIFTLREICSLFLTTTLVLFMGLGNLHSQNTDGGMYVESSEDNMLYILANMDSEQKSINGKSIKPLTPGISDNTFGQEFFLSTNPTATFVVDYNGFAANPEAMAAFQYAVDIWSRFVASTVPINIQANYIPLAPNVLGSAGTSFYLANFPMLPPDVAYPSALADKIGGSDLLDPFFGPGVPDIISNFSSTFNWYYGTDGNPAPNQFDFVTVVLHEIGHGLGFAGSMATNGNGAVPATIARIGIAFGPGGNPPFYPTPYDLEVEDAAGVKLIDKYGVGVISAGLAADVQSNNIFWGGASGVAANDGIRPQLYSPTTFRPGSSYSHLDDATFPEGTPNSLMTPFLNFAEVQHDPGLITRGIFEDIGWMVFPIPTMGQWALMILALLLSSIGVVFVYKTTKKIA